MAVPFQKGNAEKKKNALVSVESNGSENVGEKLTSQKTTLTSLAEASSTVIFPALVDEAFSSDPPSHAHFRLRLTKIPKDQLFQPPSRPWSD